MSAKRRLRVSTSSVNRRSICLVLVAALLGVGCAAGPSDSEPKQGFTAVVAGGSHSCGLRQSGEVECWGRDDYGQSSPYFGAFSAVVAAGDGTCGLRRTGTAECWGRALGPPDDSKYTSIAMHAVGRERWTCALSTSGKAGCWWAGLFADTDIRSRSEIAHPVPSGAFTAISAGQGNGCGLRPSGEVVCWDASFKTSIGEHPRPLGPFTAVTSGNHFACGLRPNGEISCWGEFSAMYQGAYTEWEFDGFFEQFELPLPSGPVTEISANKRYLCGLHPDGDVSCWGAVPERVAAQMPSGPFTTISAGDEHVCGLRSDGQAVCWGSDEYGQASPPA